MKQLSIAFLGTPDFAARLLESLVQDPNINVEFVLTQPDMPVGRKLTLTETPVKAAARSLKLNVSDGSLDSVDLKSVDLALIYAYGKIIPANFLQLPRLGFWNIHPSLLPYFRGPSPIAYPLILGEKKTGVTLIKLDKDVDHGPIISQMKMAINPMEKRFHLERELTELGSAMFRKVVRELVEESKEPVMTAQNHDDATFTRTLRKEDGYVPFEILQATLKNTPLPHDFSARVVADYAQKNKQKIPAWNQQAFYNLFRGLYPWPGIWTTLPGGKRLKITDISFKNNSLTLARVQIEGKNEVDFPTFQKAYQLL